MFRIDYFFRKTDAHIGFVERYNLPELTTGYYLSAMDAYVDYYKSLRSKVRVYIVVPNIQI